VTALHDWVNHTPPFLAKCQAGQMDSIKDSEPRTVGPSKGRVEAFSDGVFAIAITLLILEIRVPEAEDGALWNDLLRLWPSYGAYAVSFLTIGVMWVNHHHLMAFVARVDRGLLYRNLALLGVVGFIPFPTALLAEYTAGHGLANQRAAVGAYGLTMIVLSIAFTLLWSHLDRHPELTTNDGDPAVIRGSVMQAATGIAAYVVATGVAFVAPIVSLAIYALLVVAFAFARPRTPRPAARIGEDSSP